MNSLTKMPATAHQDGDASVLTGQVQNGPLVIIEDSASDFFLYSLWLEESGHDFTDILHFSTLAEAKGYLSKNTPTCCILDNILPDGCAMDLITELKDGGTPLEFPIVVSTGQGDEKVAVELMQLGIQGYLIKRNLTSKYLIDALQSAIEKFIDKANLYYLANYDGLTGLLNRPMFMQRLVQAVNEAKRYNRLLELCYLDVDDFKQINDTYGHTAGDEILREVAKTIQKTIRETDSVARLGGDEFVILLPEAGPFESKLVANKLIQAFSAPIPFENNMISVKLSIGIASFTKSRSSANDLIKLADEALYQAKENGRDGYYHSSENRFGKKELQEQMVRALPVAIKENLLQLNFQPVFNTRSNAVVSVETFVRWRYQDAWISAHEIMALVGKCDMHLVFHQWLFRQAFEQFKRWLHYIAELKLSLNMPARVFHDPFLLMLLYEEIEINEIEATSLILEFDEQELSQDRNLVCNVLEDISGKGFKIAIDNFGTGTSAIEHLVQIPCDILKLDVSLFESEGYTQTRLKAIDALVVLGKKLGFEIVAEGIDSLHSEKIAKLIGCDSVQGYLKGRPVRPEMNFTHFLDKSMQYGNLFLSSPQQMAQIPAAWVD